MPNRTVEDDLLDAYHSSAVALNHIALLWLAVVPESREPVAAAPLYGGGLAHVIAVIQEHVEHTHAQARKALASVRNSFEER